MDTKAAKKSRETSTRGMEYGIPGQKRNSKEHYEILPPDQYATALAKRQGYDAALRILAENAVEFMGSAPNQTLNLSHVYYKNALGFLKKRSPKKNTKTV